MMDVAFDPTSREFAQDPYATYAQLRQLGEPVYFEPMDAWLVGHYDEVDRLARNPDMVRSLEGIVSAQERREQQRARNWHDMPNHERFVQFSLLETDGEVHRRLRMTVLRDFSRVLIEQQRSMIQVHVDHLLDELLARQEVDFVSDFAARVPGHVIGRVLGLPAADGPQLRAWSEQIVQFFDADRTAADKQLAERATTEFYDYLTEQIEFRRARPQDDLLSTLVRGQQAGQMNETELISTAMLILAGGHGSTIDVLGTGLLGLLKFPEQMAKLRRSPALIHTAVQEMFRYDSPLPFFHRFARQDVEVLGRAFPAGTKFGLLYGSANRDPVRFADPDSLDIERDPNRHLAFGRGAHLCLGNNLARLDMEIVFLTLLRRTRSIELLENEPRYRPGLTSRGLESLAVSLLA